MAQNGIQIPESLPICDMQVNTSNNSKKDRDKSHINTRLRKKRLVNTRTQIDSVSTKSDVKRS